MWPGPVVVKVPDALFPAGDRSSQKALYSELPQDPRGEPDEGGEEDDEGESRSLQIYRSGGWKICRHFLNPFAVHNSGLTLSFINVGIASYFLYAPVSFYLINTLNASPAEYSAFATLATLPWSLKFLFGVLSDTTPIFKYRRKSWLLIGWLFYIAFGIFMSYQEQPSILITTLIFFLSTCMYLLADVCSDTLCVERGRVFETPLTKGTMQTSGYTSRAFGSIVGAILGALLFNTSRWGWGLSISQLFLLSALIPIFPLLPSIWYLVEIRSVHGGGDDWSIASSSPSPDPRTNSKSSSSSSSSSRWSEKQSASAAQQQSEEEHDGFVPPTLREQLWSIWQTLQLRAVYRPLTFIFSFYLLQIPNSAWQNFLLVGLKFTDYEVGAITVAQCVFLWLGMVCFKLFFFRTPWRDVFIYTTLISVFFSVMQVVLILRINKRWGLPDFLFALGDTAAVQFTYAIQSMPSSIMFVMLCPPGNEGVTYALLTTVGNLAWTIAQDLGGALTLVFDVKNESLARGDFTGVLHLTLFTSLVQLLPVSFVFLLPKSPAEHEALIAKQSRSFYGGFVLASIIALGLVGSIAVNIYYILWH